MSLFDCLSSLEKKLIRKKSLPDFIKPMLATLTDERFSDKNWVFERKLDGERCLLFKKGKNITLKSRNDNVVNVSYPEIVNALKQLTLPDCILDGEIVAFEKKESRFSLLQERFGLTKNVAKLSGSRYKVYYYVFDITYYQGYDLTSLPLITRKHILKSLIPFKGIIRYVPCKPTYGEKYFKQACGSRWEGVIAKQKDSTYVHKRSSNWLKFKCSNDQEFVIGGYTEPGGARAGFGALLLGYYENNKLHYAGKVGTGFNDELLRDLGNKLKKLETSRNPFCNFDVSTAGVHWVRPVLVCQIQFTEWTRDNKLRHPSYTGLRRDKKAKDVIKEKAK